MNVLVFFFVILVMVVVNVFYVVVEFVIVGLCCFWVQEVVEVGNSVVGWLLYIFKDFKWLDNYVVVCQIGIIFFSLVVGFYG